MTRSQEIKNLSIALESIAQEKNDFFIFMVDLCGSTIYKQYCITQNIPEVMWVARQLIFLQTGTEKIEAFDGQIVKTIGDMVMAIFPHYIKVDNIIKCGLEVVQTYQGLKAFNNGPGKMIAKVAIDFGETFNGNILPANQFDPVGSCVDRCARLESVANPNEIVFSSDVKNSLEQQIGVTAALDKYGYSTVTRNLTGIGLSTYYSIDAS